MSSTTTTTTVTNGNGYPPRFSFTSLPPFPDDVATAPLLKLSLAKLLARNGDEVARFVRACEDVGFFYLDLSDDNSTSSDVVQSSNSPSSSPLGDRLLSSADRLFDLGEELFDLDLVEKKKYDFMDRGSYFGYKEFGANVTDRQGNLDRNEFYNVSKDDIFDLSERWPAPDCIANRRPVIKSFMADAHSIVTLFLELLNDHLGLPAGTLQSKHRLEGRSGDQVRFLKAPPQPIDDHKMSLGEHTDFGSVTVLFNRLGGLQILPPGKGAEWCYVKPIPNHAIVNLGDAMVKFTNGLLRSNIHRVVPPPGAQSETTRYSLVYFSRPENEIPLKRLEGSDKIPPLAEGETEEDVNAQDWIIRRALGHRHAVHGKDAFDLDRLRGTEDISRRDR